MIRLAIATTTSMMFIGSRSWPRATSHTDALDSSFSWLGPYVPSRAEASSGVSPRSRSVPRSSATCSGDSVCQAVTTGTSATLMGAA